MIDIKKLVNELATYALAKKGAQEGVDSDLHETPEIMLPCVGWGVFFQVRAEDAEGESISSQYGDDMKNAHFNLQMPVFSNRLLELQQRYPSIVQSDWMERDGHAFMTIPLPPEDGLTIESLKLFVDEAYTLIWDKLDEDDRFMIEAANTPFDNRTLLDQLIDKSKLQSIREEIHQLARPAILLKTTNTTNEDVPLGASKIGGVPDLPVNVEWPRFLENRPLTFLAQLNLAEVSKHQHSLQGLPEDGVLSLFSAWGWASDGDPEASYMAWGNELGCSVFLYSKKNQKLKRCAVPEDVNSYPAAEIELVEILSFPPHTNEPNMEKLKWTEEEYAQYDEMLTSLRSIQMAYWINNMNSEASHHLLGGYALFEHGTPDMILENNSLTMLLQIGTDRLTDMCWGDGDSIAFHVDNKALSQGQFEQVWCE